MAESVATYLIQKDKNVSLYIFRIGGAHLVGTVTRMAHAVLAAGGHPDPDDPPQLDAHSVRRHFARYPIRFTEAAA